jgi:hypothetical protein
MTLTAGTKLDGYEVLGPIGAGPLAMMTISADCTEQAKTGAVGSGFVV